MLDEAHLKRLAGEVKGPHAAEAAGGLRPAPQAAPLSIY